MRDPQAASEAEPPELLDDHLALIRRHAGTALPAAAIRTRSLGARELIARAALGSHGTLADLLRAARDGDHAWLRRAPGPRVQSLCALAQTLAMQDLLPADRRDALAVYELVRGALGAASASPGHAGLHAQLAFRWEGPEKARELLAAYRQVPGPVRRDLLLDLDNPFAGPAGRPVGPWFAAFRQLLPEPWPTLRTDDAVVPFDRLTSPEPPGRVEAPQRVSVVVTAYRPDEGLLTAVRSILAQTWANVEVVIVDDASPPEYDETLRRAVALGPRIRLVRQPANAGTYAARNAGLDAAEGEFVTFQDSDDWSHPRRLELQVRPLLDRRDLVATTSDGLSVTEDLTTTRPGVRSGRFNPSSLLLRRGVVVGRVGYFDDVRKAADSEYIGRIRAAFSERAVHHVDAGALALIRLSQNSLSRAEIRAFWMHPARVAYSSAYLCWHEGIAAGTARPYRPRDGADRPFPAPPHLRQARGGAPAARRYDVVVLADWRFLEGTHDAALEELRALAGAGLSVAVAHVESYRTVLRRRLPLSRPVQQLVNDGVVDQVAVQDDVEAGLVLVRQAAALQFAPADPGGVRPGQVLVVADRAPARGDGRDRRYRTDTCTRAARRLFGVEPLWCPQDAAVRAALLAQDPQPACTPYDLPAVVDGGRWAAPRGAGRGDAPVVGTDLCDAASPADLAAALAVYAGLDFADVRLRLPDAPHLDAAAARTPARLVYAAADLDARTFLHQLDFYLHFPHPRAAETFSRPALHAAATGCVVVLPERFAPLFGDAAVYCAPGEVAALVRRYRRDRDLFAGQSRRARAVAAEAHHRRLYVDRVAALVRAPRVPAQAQRGAAAPAERP
jgi:O-antigen biosynthesis protein